MDWEGWEGLKPAAGGSRGSMGGFCIDCLSSTTLSFVGLWPSDTLPGTTDWPSVCTPGFPLPSSVRHPLPFAAEWFESVPALSGIPEASDGSRDLARSEGDESSERGVDCLDASFRRPAV